MAEQAPLYDLLLLLSETATDEQRAKVLADVESAIGAAGGAVERNDDWGHRPTAYEIRHQAEAEYHLIQFRSPADLIEELSHTLRITDGVLRFRVIKNRPGTPAAPSSPPPVVAPATPSGSAGGPSRSDGARAGTERAPAALAAPGETPDSETTDES